VAGIAKQLSLPSGRHCQAAGFVKQMLLSSSCMTLPSDCQEVVVGKHYQAVLSLNLRPLVSWGGGTHAAIRRPQHHDSGDQPLAIRWPPPTPIGNQVAR
jgi:hypothetical protein